MANLALCLLNLDVIYPRLNEFVYLKPKKKLTDRAVYPDGSIDTSSGADQDPGSGIRCLFDPWIRDPGWVESQHPDPGSGMNNPDHIF